MRLTDETVATLRGFVPARDLRRMRVVTRWPFCWFPAALGMAAATVGPFVMFRRGSFDTATPNGLSLIAHEAHHICQAREMGQWQFFLRYMLGNVRCRFHHDRHPLEVPAIELQRRAERSLQASGTGQLGPDDLPHGP